METREAPSTLQYSRPGKTAESEAAWQKKSEDL